MHDKHAAKEAHTYLVTFRDTTGGFLRVSITASSADEAVAELSPLFAPMRAVRVCKSEDDQS